MNEQLVARRFVPWRFFLGLGFVPLGGFLVYASLFTDWLSSARRVPIMFLLLAGAVSLAGVVLVATCFARSCVACRKALDSTALLVPTDWEGWLCELARSGQAASLGALAQAPAVPPGYPATALDIAFCPACRRVGELHAARRVPDGKGSFQDSKLTEPVLFAGQEIGWLVDLAKARSPQA